MTVWKVPVKVPKEFLRNVYAIEAVTVSTVKVDSYFKITLNITTKNCSAPESVLKGVLVELVYQTAAGDWLLEASCPSGHQDQP